MGQRPRRPPLRDFVPTVPVTGRADLTDTQWKVQEPLVPRSKKPGRPPKWSRPRPPALDPHLDKQRHAVDRAVATRYDQLAVRHEAIHIAAVNEWLRPDF